ncbi:MAG: lipase [Ruminococcus sp.]|nr:lipase [Ruminococcus sp.]MBQ8296935.1 lipase [Ruminococcus sp.]
MSENKMKWTGAWGNAISITERRPENYAKNLTLRYPVKMMLSGQALRITLDNFCGSEAVTVTSASIAFSDGNDAIKADSMKNVTFGGCGSVTIPAGERITSDPIEFDVRCGDDIAVSLYLADFTEMRSGVLITGPLSKGYFAIGNQTAETMLDPDTSKKTNWFYFLSDIEVLTAAENRAVICYGDSITAQAWPDYLMQRTLEIGDGTTAIVRKAASGTRILRQYDNITYDSYGLRGELRFPREALVPGADTIIIQHGINDIIHPVGTDVNRFRPWSDLPTAQEMTDGLRRYLEKAREYNLKTYLGTLLPIEGWRTYADFREELRCEVNEWIRTTNEADGCIDFDRAVCNPDRPSSFAEGYDSGDHLHPSQAAYKRMAEEVPGELLYKIK